MDSHWDPLVAAAAGYMLTAVARLHQLFPVLGLIRPATVTGFFAVALYASNLGGVRHPRLLVVPATRRLLWLLGWMALAVPGALVPGASFDLLFDNFIKTVLMCFVIAGSVRTVRDVERLAMVYLAGATIYAAVVIFRFDLGSGEAWRLGRLYYYDANDLATFAVTAMPLGLYVVHSGRTTVARILGAAALTVLTLAFVRTGSRGGFVALIVVAAYVMWRSRSIAIRWRFAAAALVALVVAGSASDQYWKQMSTIASDADYNRIDESGRMQIWERGLGYMLENPVFGVGAGNFQAAEGLLSPFADRQQMGVGVRWNAAHNSFIQVGAELGIPGLLFFVGVIAGAFRALRTERQWPASDSVVGQPALTQALSGSLIGFVAGAFFLSLAYSEMFYTLVALAVGLQKTITWERWSRG